MLFLCENLFLWFQRMPEPWQCFVYQYGVGGFFFFFTMFVAIHGKTIRLNTRIGKVTLALILGGFFFAMIVHGTWIYLLTK